MNSDEEYLREELANVLQSASAQTFLFLYWLLANQRLKRSADESVHLRPLDRRTEGVQEWAAKVKEHIEITQDMMLQLRRVEGYLGRAPKRIDPQIARDIESIELARTIRTLIENGSSDQGVATFLRPFLPPFSPGKRGRPAGTVNYDGHALLALVLYDQNPKAWSYPKLADDLLECKVHKKHQWDTSCTVDLRKAVERLRVFLGELGYKQAAT